MSFPEKASVVGVPISITSYDDVIEKLTNRPKDTSDRSGGMQCSFGHVGAAEPGAAGGYLAGRDRHS